MISNAKTSEQKQPALEISTMEFQIQEKSEY